MCNVAPCTAKQKQQGEKGNVTFPVLTSYFCSYFLTVVFVGCCAAFCCWHCLCIDRILLLPFRLCCRGVVGVVLLLFIVRRGLRSWTLVGLSRSSRSSLLVLSLCLRHRLFTLILSLGLEGLVFVSWPCLLFVSYSWLLLALWRCHLVFSLVLVSWSCLLALPLDTSLLIVDFSS